MTENKKTYNLYLSSTDRITWTLFIGKNGEIVKQNINCPIYFNTPDAERNLKTLSSSISCSFEAIQIYAKILPDF